MLVLLEIQHLDNSNKLIFQIGNLNNNIMPTIKDLYDANYAETLNSAKYIDYLKGIRSKIDNAADFNQLNKDIAELETDLHKENNKLSLHATDETYIASYNLVKAIEGGTSIDEGTPGYKEFNEYRDEVSKLGSQLDEKGNIIRQASKVMFAFDADYDFNNFLENTGYNVEVLTQNDVPVSRINGKRVITIDKGNPLFSSVLYGVNSIDDMSDSQDIWEWYGKALSRPFKRAIRNASNKGEGFLNSIKEAGHGVLSLGYNLIGGQFDPNPHVTMFGIDDNDIIIKNNGKGVKSDNGSFLDYKAIGDNALKYYKSSLEYLQSHRDEDDDLGIETITALGYVTANQAKARKYKDDTGDFDGYNKFEKEEKRRLDIAVMQDNLANHEVFIDENGDGIVRPADITEVSSIQRILRAAIAEGGETNEGNRVTYSAGYNTKGDVGLYITIADKTDTKGNLTSNFNYTNTNAGRTIFVKDMLTNTIKEAIYRDTHHRANMEVNEMIRYNYDYYLSNGDKILQPSNQGGTFVSADGGEKRHISTNEMRARLNEDFATQDAINYFLMEKNALNSLKDVPELTTEEHKKLFSTAAGIVTDSYKNLPQAEKITRATTLYLKMCTTLGIKPE